MICRMNRQQREGLVALIEAIIKENTPGANITESLQRMEAEEKFHSLFKNEDDGEDNYAEGT